MDIKNELESIVKKITSDKNLMEQFKKDPAAAVKKATGLDIPKDQLDKVVTAVKAKMGADAAGDALNKLGGLFGKK